MEVEASSVANCTTDYCSLAVTQMPAVAIASVPAVSDSDTIPTQIAVDIAADVNTGNAVQAKQVGLPEIPLASEPLASTEKNAVHEKAASEEPPVPNPPPTEVAVKTDVGKYRLIRTIGKGNFAKVKLAIHMATGAEVAIKIINKTLMDSTLLNRLRREITIMKITNHPNIVRLLEIIENEDVLCLVMEYASGGEIFDYLVANGKMREKEARAKFRQLLSAIQYCHSKRIVHRDLKAENILLDRNLNVKVADFGLANTFDHDQRLKTFCGSPPYAAPELFLGIPYYGPGVDVWSLGVILFTLVLGHLPFDARDLRELRSKIIGLHYTIPKGSVSPECEALLRKMLVLDPKDRSSLKYLMQDKWVNWGYPPSDILRPFKESSRSQLDEVRVKAMEAMGFTRADLESSVVNPEFDHVYATYHLLPETPSQFMVLCEEFSKLQTSQTSATVALPNALVASQTSPRIRTRPSVDSNKNPVEIGRFTVAPSSEHGAKQVVLPKQPTPGAESSIREHHSLTSTLPVALKRAFVQMGHVFGSPHSPGTSGHAPETQSRHAHQATSGRVSSKSHKPDSGRSAITTAPVPIISPKKTHTKRGSPHPAPLTPSAAVARTGSSESTSTTSTPTTSRSTAVPRVPPTALGGAAAPTLSSRKKDLKPYSNTTSPRTSAPKQYDNVPLESSRKIHPTTERSETPKPSPAISGTEANPEVKLTGSSSTSSDSYSEASVRRKSASSVQDVWLTTKSENTASVCQTPSKTDATPSRPSDPTVKSVVFETQTPGPQVSVQQASKERWSPEGERQSIVSASSTQPKVSHTVQGNEAKVMMEEAMKAQNTAGARPSIPSAAVTATYVIDPGHSNTWSRGVFKALGGFFAPSKPSDHRLQTAAPNGSILSGPREVRFPWSVHTTSTKPADDVLKEIKAALEVTPGCRYSPDPHLPYLLRCSWAPDRGSLRSISAPSTVTPQSDDSNPTPEVNVLNHRGSKDDPVHWEMEVCQLPRLHLRGVRVKRIRGPALQFRPIADLVMRALHL